LREVQIELLSNLEAAHSIQALVTHRIATVAAGAIVHRIFATGYKKQGDEQKERFLQPHARIFEMQK
jgi:hypothetical protein